MKLLSELLRRLRFRFGGSRFDEDLAEEMKLHQQLRAEQKQAEGMSASDAEAAARRQFGNTTRMAEISREAWGWTFLDRLAQDVRYGLRALAANPGFALTAVLSLALGIGANTAIFSIVNALMLRSLPVEDPRQLVELRNGSYTNPIWEQIRDHQNAIQGVLAYSTDRFDLAGGGESRFAIGMWVSGSFFRVLGVPAFRGRVLTTEDDRRGGGPSGPVAVISYKFWKSRFGGGDDAIGKTVRLNRHTFEIVGVTPPWFNGLEVDHGFDVAIPIGCDPIIRTDGSSLDNHSFWWLRILGRLAPGQSLRQAEDRLRALTPEILRATVPQNWDPAGQQEYLKRSFRLVPAATGFSDMGSQYRTALLTLMGIVGLVLLIACANIANLQLARGAARQRELGVRMAIGAGRARVVRQLMTESLLVAFAGALAGLAAAQWSGRLLLRLISQPSQPLDIDLSLDLRVLAFTMGIAVLTALIFGLVPALRATRLGLSGALKDNARGTVAGGSRWTLGKSLVTGQVALSLVLVVAAGLFAGTLRNLLAVDAGFDRRNVVLVSAGLEQASIPKDQRVRVFTEILERLRAIPGVQSAASSMLTPISHMFWNNTTEPEGYRAKSKDDTLVYFNRVSPGYFRTMRTTLLVGRDFDGRDTLKAPLAIVLGETAARRFFGPASPVGKTIKIESEPNQKDTYQVIGVVKDAKYGELNETTLLTGYVPAAQDKEPWGNVSYALRSEAPIEMLRPAIAAAFGAVNRSISLEIRSLESQVEGSLTQQRMLALLAAAFGALALALAMVGLYGVTAYAVARRQAEIGIRMALGAAPRSVVWLMLRGMVLHVAAGLALGLAAALAAGRLVASLLYGVRANDPAHLAGSALILAFAAALAAYLPARRAARLDPMAALREE
ncbi:MAG TPA: ABC transporter permease [Bryobacteraceae bacterium]